MSGSHGNNISAIFKKEAILVFDWKIIKKIRKNKKQ